MGFLDKFKKGNKSNKANDTVQTVARQQTQSSYEFVTYPGQGGMFIEMIDNTYEVGKFYDTTRIFISDTPIYVAGRPLKQCWVSWYGKDDCVMLGKDGEEIGRRTDYSVVLADINMDNLQSDYTYSVALMRDLFKQTRVMSYLQRGQQDSPEIPCGNYIGYIKEDYRKGFNTDVGRAAHNTPEMQALRTRIKEQAEIARQREILYTKDQISKLQGQLNDLEGR